MAPWIAVDINGAPVIRAPAARGQSALLLFQGMNAGTVKHVRFWKDTVSIVELLLFPVSGSIIAWGRGNG